MCVCDQGRGEKGLVATSIIVQKLIIIIQRLIVLGVIWLLEDDPVGGRLSREVCRDNLVVRWQVDNPKIVSAERFRDFVNPGLIFILPPLQVLHKAFFAAALFFKALDPLREAVPSARAQHGIVSLVEGVVSFSSNDCLELAA